MEQKSLNLSHISLRPFTLSDTDDLMVWATDEQVTKFCSWEPYKSKDTAIEFIQNIPKNFSWCHAICFEDRAIGSVSVQCYSGNDKARVRSAELGYVLGSEFWGKGVATKVVKMVVETVFDEFPDIERLEALVDVDNLGSQRVLEKAGFMREGILRKFLFVKGKSRDMVMFSLLSDDVRA